MVINISITSLSERLLRNKQHFCGGWNFETATFSYLFVSHHYRMSYYSINIKSLDVDRIEMTDKSVRRLNIFV